MAGRCGTLLCGLLSGLLSSHLLAADAFTQPPPESLPRVTSAAVPFYPQIARRARIEGTVVLRITTDGKKVFGLIALSGPPMLSTAAAVNAKTWQFEEHTPMTFDATFRYKWVPGNQTHEDSGTVTL